MSVGKKIVWGLVIAFVVFGVVSVFVTRYAAIMAVRQGPPTFKVIPESVTRSQGGMMVKARLLTPKDVDNDVLLVTTFMIFEVEIAYQGTEFIDFDYFKFAVWDGDHRVRPLSPDEVSREITGRFLGTSISAQSTGRQMDMIQKADKAMLNSARVFPGYKRKGWVLFSVPQEMGKTITLEMNQVRTPKAMLDPFVFRFEVQSS